MRSPPDPRQLPQRSTKTDTPPSEERIEILEVFTGLSDICNIAQAQRRCKFSLNYPQVRF